MDQARDRCRRLRPEIFGERFRMRRLLPEIFPGGPGAKPRRSPRWLWNCPAAMRLKSPGAARARKAAEKANCPPNQFESVNVEAGLHSSCSSVHSRFFAGD